jgi:hypothetical protein
LWLELPGRAVADGDPPPSVVGLPASRRLKRDKKVISFAEIVPKLSFFLAFLLVEGKRELLLLLETGLLAWPLAPLRLRTLQLGIQILSLLTCLRHCLNRWKFLEEAINFIKRYDSH